MNNIFYGNYVITHQIELRKYCFFFAGIIFFELLTIVQKESRIAALTAVRQGIFPSNNGLNDIEKCLINHILYPDEKKRLKQISQIIETVEDLAEEGKTTLHCDTSKITLQFKSSNNIS